MCSNVIVEINVSYINHKCNELMYEVRHTFVLFCSLAGVSRSVTVTAAYIMTVTNLGWRDTLNAIRGARNCANPNFGFQKQLQEYEMEGLDKVTPYRLFVLVYLN